MQRNDFELNAAKTAVLLGCINFISAPLSAIVFGLRLGIGFLIAENVFALYQFNERGKSERRIENIATSGTSFFGSAVKKVSPTSELVQKAESIKVDNILHNIAAGGAAYNNEFTSFVMTKMNNRS